MLRIVSFWDGKSRADQRTKERETIRRNFCRMTFDTNQKYAVEDGKPLVHPPQKKLALEVFNAFCTSIALLITICAPMQWGKTGVIVYLAYRALALATPVPKVRRMVVITGMSDNDWANQTKARFDCLGVDNGVSVFHRGALRKQADLLAKLRDTIIVIDECHVGNGKKQMLDKILGRAGLLDRVQLVHRNVRIVQISATPGSSLVVPEGWKDGGLHVKMVADWRIGSYISPLDIVEEGRLLGTRDLTQMEHVRDAVVPFARDGRTGIVFVRTPNKLRDEALVIRNFEKVNAELEDELEDAVGAEPFEILKHDSEDRNTDTLDKYLKEGPGKLVVVLIRKFFLAAKTFDCHDHILALYEPPTR